MNLGYDCRYGEMYFFFPQSKAEKKFNSISVEENLSLIPTQNLSPSNQLLPFHTHLSQSSIGLSC